MPLRIMSKSYILISYLKLFQNGGRSNFWDDTKILALNVGQWIVYADRYWNDEQL
jgi:hypothetical protein